MRFDRQRRPAPLRQTCRSPDSPHTAETSTKEREMSHWPGDSRTERTTFGGLPRGELMSRISAKGNKTTEARLASLLRKAGLTGWRRNLLVLGRPDFVWRKSKLAVFVDGCFWHGHDCGRNLTPKTNARAWSEKIRRNKARDRHSASRLRQLGWRVLRIWECQLARRPGASLARIRRGLTL